MWIAICLLAGLLGLGAGIRESVIQRRLQREGISVSGLVVHHQVRSGKDGPVHFAVIEFVDALGRRQTFQAGLSGVKGLPVGGEVPVRYLPDAPENARIDLRGRRIHETAFSFVIGLLMLTAGVWILATGR